MQRGGRPALGLVVEEELPFLVEVVVAGQEERLKPALGEEVVEELPVPLGQAWAAVAVVQEGHHLGLGCSSPALVVEEAGLQVRPSHWPPAQEQEVVGVVRQ